MLVAIGIFVILAIVLFAAWVYVQNFSRGKKLIGLSLSHCLRKIVDGVVAEESVDSIEAMTKCPDLETYLALVQVYFSSSKPEVATKAREVAIRLWDGKKIHQPLLAGKPGHYVGNGFWKDEYENAFYISTDGTRQYSGKKVVYEES